jgi:D-glycero-beta-D-manno-heptose-7-phosphate kinase
MQAAQLDGLFEAMNKLHVMVVGDVMLDYYWWGDVERISPEAPVPVVALSRRENRMGGAANVALNCRALGAKVTLASVVGADNEAEVLIKLATEAGIKTDLLLKSKHRPTTTKIRVISRSQQMLRIDDEVTTDLTTEEEHPFLDAVLRFLQIEKPDLVIFEDYNKGVLKENVIKRIMNHCVHIGIVTAVDPKKHNFFSYSNVTIFKPNLKETREGLHIGLNQPNEESLQQVHQALYEQLHHQITFITLSERGVYYNAGAKSGIFPSHIRNIADVSGAGDTVIAVAGLVYCLTKDAELMAIISNLAGGLVCEEVGVVAINKNKLLAESKAMIAND